MKAKAFLNDLIIYDYVLFGAAFALFILFIILGLVLRQKTLLAVFLILLGFSILILAPTLGYIEMHKYLFKNTTTITEQKKLKFTEAIVIKGTLLNESKMHFKRCLITASVHKLSKNKYKNYLLQFKPIQKSSIVEEDISRGQTREFKLFITPFTYSGDYNVTIKGGCK